MPGRRIEMRKLKEVLRLRLTVGLSNRKIALCTGVGKSAVSKHVARAEELGLDWRRVEAMAEEAIEALLYPPSGEAKPGGQLVPDWDEVARELRRKGVTKRLLWEEYREELGARAYSYSRYCELYKTVPGMPLCLCACSRDHTAQLPEVNASNVHHPPVAVGGWWGTKPGFALGTSGFASGYAVTSRRGIFRSEQSAQNEKWWSRRGRHCGPAAEYGRSRGGRRPAGAGRRGGRAAYGHPLVGRRPIPGQGAECARTPALVGSE